MFVFCIILESWLSGQFKKLMIHKHILQIMTEKWLWIWFLSVYFLQSDLHHKKLCRPVIFDNLLHCNTILECWEHVDSYTFSEMLWTFVFDKEIEKNTCPKKVAIPCTWRVVIVKFVSKETFQQTTLHKKFLTILIPFR